MYLLIKKLFCLTKKKNMTSIMAMGVLTALDEKYPIFSLSVTLPWSS